MSLSVVLSNCPTDKASELARELVQRRLAACVNIVPQMQSIYRWQGDIQQDNEALLIIKTTRSAELFDAVVDLHPYEVPELIEMAPEAVLSVYEKWATDQCKNS